MTCKFSLFSGLTKSVIQICIYEVFTWLYITGCVCYVALYLICLHNNIFFLFTFKAWSTLQQNACGITAENRCYWVTGFVNFSFVFQT